MFFYMFESVFQNNIRVPRLYDDQIEIVFKQSKWNQSKPRVTQL